MSSFVTLQRRLYYELKPYVPWSVRIAVRRLSAQRKRKASVANWPIDPSSARVPAGWPGWPHGKKFALVLTHDVEGPQGLAKCRDLAELEIDYGLRSSFNLIPEGSYAVPSTLRAWLEENGFEVGVHDLHHDGRLYNSRASFRSRAHRINHHLNDWGAAGFRSGFMMRELDWIHDLDIQYDASTFDTDPFEFQPEGTGTIFPFWIQPPPSAHFHDPNGATGTTSAPRTSSSAAARGGYLELPYTLPQDSTLFLVLREKSPEIWLRKLDWIAQHGGMAMVNVHPDYIDFRGHCRRNEYPSEHYKQLLRYVQETYAGQFWNPTPKELTAWFQQTRTQIIPTRESGITVAASNDVHTGPTTKLAGKKAAVLLYSHYPSDPRPRRAAEAMVEAGMTVDLLCLANAERDEASHQIVHGVNVSRVQLKHRRDSKLTYLWQYGRFLLSSFWFLTSNGLRRRYDVVHVHNMPDFLVFAALVPKLRGAKLILDLHDPMPELMMSIYGLESHDWKVGLLRTLERWSIGFANLVLTPNKSFKDLFVSRSCRAEKMQIVMNSPEETIFDPDLLVDAPAAEKTKGEFHVMHHGSILHRHGVDLLVEAIAIARAEIPGLHLDIYGFRDAFLDTVLEAARRLRVDDIVHYHGPKSQRDIAAAIRACDVGIVPNRRTPFTEINFPTRLFEYLSMHRPVIAPATKGIQDYFGPDQIITFTAEDVSDLAAKIVWVYRHREAAQAFVTRGLIVYRHHLWRNEKRRFQEHVAAIVSRSR